MRYRVVFFFLLLRSSTLVLAQEVFVTGAMKEVMWKGETQGVIRIDTLYQPHLYGLGPMAGLRGEVMVWDGVVYLSQVAVSNTLQVWMADTGSLPFFAHAHISGWKPRKLPASVTDLKLLEAFLLSLPGSGNAPFFFTLKGKIRSGIIHCVYLPVGARVRNPEEAHQGKQSFSLQGEEVTVLGFFSTQHQGIFTHHDTFLHLHLLTADGRYMGHVDELSWKKGLRLYLPLAE